MKNKLFYVVVSIVLTITATISIMNRVKLNLLNSPSKEIKKEICTEYSYLYDCMKEAELNYQKTKAILSEEVQSYITSVAPTSNLKGYAIVEECENFNIDIKFVLAQGEIESHFATKGIGGKLNNVFNVGVFDDLNSSEVADRYRYNYPNQSIRPYLELLSRKYLVNKLEEDLLGNFIDINGNRYASDPNYESKLKDKYTFILMHTKIDSLQKQMHNYALKCNRR